MVRVLAVAVLAFGIAAQARAELPLTQEQAETLPVRELASRVLGEAGASMVAVDRPYWPGTRFGRGVPPINNMTFYQRPMAASAPDGWDGLCRSLTATVSFDQSGSARLLDTGAVYGVAAGGLKRLPPHYDPVRQAQAAEAQCAALTPPEMFFSVGIHDNVGAIVVLLKTLSETQAKDGQWPFTYACRDQFGGDCRATLSPAAVAADLLANGGWRRGPSGCDLPQTGKGRLPHVSCITLERGHGCSTPEMLTLSYQSDGGAYLPRGVTYVQGSTAIVIC